MKVISKQKTVVCYIWKTCEENLTITKVKRNRKFISITTIEFVSEPHHLIRTNIVILV